MKFVLIIDGLARSLALFGGFVLLAITIITCVSIFGRVLIPVGLMPVPGDFELVQAGVGFAIFAFLPWCQVTRGHASVDLFTNFLPKSINRWIDLFTEVLMAVALIVITWKLWDGAVAKYRYGDTTFILEFPIWWAYAASLFAAVIGCVTALYMVVMRIIEVATGKSQFNTAHGVVH